MYASTPTPAGKFCNWVFKTESLEVDIQTTVGGGPDCKSKQIGLRSAPLGGWCTGKTCTTGLGPTPTLQWFTTIMATLQIAEVQMVGGEGYKKRLKQVPRLLVPMLESAGDARSRTTTPERVFQSAP